jgi:hypothetical protein
MQSRYEALCHPSAPKSVEVQNWKPRELCAGDCFTAKLTCSSGKSYRFATELNPTVSAREATLYRSGAWLFPLVALAVLLIAIGIGIVSGSPALSLLINAPFLLYAISTMTAVYQHVGGNPSGGGAGLWPILLNEYLIVSMVVLFLAVNLSVLWRALDILFYRHPAEIAIAPTTLMPINRHFVDVGSPRASAAFYHQEARRFDALREKFDAQARFFRAGTDYFRSRNAFHDEL